MGNLMDLARNALQSVLGSFSDRDAKLLMLGLDAAGKTTVLHKLKLNEVVSTIPTIGFNVETLQPVKNVSFTVWDIGGQETLRSLWRHYLTNTDGLVFIVDSADHQRFTEAKGELDWILDSEEMKGVPLVVLANKQDLGSSRSPSLVAEKLGLHTLRDREWYVQGTSAVSGDGLLEGMQKLSSLVKDFQKGSR